jgi:hypothetical protein
MGFRREILWVKIVQVLEVAGWLEADDFSVDGSQEISVS